MALRGMGVGSRVLVEPGLREVLPLVQESLKRREVLLLVGRCRVEYEGRAESRLGPGERILMVKGDGSVLVHRPSGVEPVNYQPRGNLFRTHMADGELVFHAVRSKPHEALTVRFTGVSLAAGLRLVDRSHFTLHAGEEDMQRAVLLHPELVEPGFRPITEEKRTEPGFIDVFGRDAQGNFVVVEIKREAAGRREVTQLKRYLDTLRAPGSTVRGILMAPRLATGAQRMLHALGLEYKPLSPRRCAEVLRGSGESLLGFLHPPTTLEKSGRNNP